MRARMFWRILHRSLLVRRNSSLTALAAIMVAAAVSTTMLNLYLEVQSKLRSEFRGYGANLILMSPMIDNPRFTTTVEVVDRLVAGHGTYVPYTRSTGATENGLNITVIGTDFEKARLQNSWWAVTQWPASNEVLVGSRLALQLPARYSQTFDLVLDGKTHHFPVGGIVHTGASEDHFLFVPQENLTALTGLTPNMVEIAADGNESEILGLSSRLKAALPGVEVVPVRRILSAEANVFGKTRKALLAAVIIIILTAILCVLATLTSSVLDRRRDFALMKALGASQRTANALFAAEAAALGILGSVAGFLIGVGFATWIGRVNFHAPIAPRFDVLLPVVAGGLLLTLIAAMLPISLLRGAQPAVLLKGE